MGLAAASSAASLRKSMFRLSKKADQGLISISSQQFDQYVLGAPRTYSVVFLLTATNPRFGCEACDTIKTMMSQIAHAYQAQRYAGGSKSPKHQLFFATVDYDEKNERTFQELQIETIPKIMFVGPSKGPAIKASSFFDTLGDENQFFLETATDLVHDLVDFIQQRSGIELVGLDKKKRSGDAMGLQGNASSISSVEMGLIITLLFLSPIAYRFRYSPMLYFVIASLAFTACISGFMFNVLRSVPYFQVDSKGALKWMTQGTNNQLGAEGLLIGFCQAAVGVFFLLMNTQAIKMNNMALRNGLLALCLVVSWQLFGWCRTWFDVKIGGYNAGHVWDWTQAFNF